MVACQGAPGTGEQWLGKYLPKGDVFCQLTHLYCCQNSQVWSTEKEMLRGEHTDRTGQGGVGWAEQGENPYL